MQKKDFQRFASSIEIVRIFHPPFSSTAIKSEVWTTTKLNMKFEKRNKPFSKVNLK